MFQVKSALFLAGGALLLASGMVRVLGGADTPATAGARSEEKCPVAAKVSTLLESWKAAAAAAAAVPEAEQARLRTELASVAAECPVGSRVGETLGFVKAVLASTVQLESACAKQCPIDASGDKAAIELKAARGRLLSGLDELAGRVTAACACASASAKGAAADPAALPEKALLLLASWDRAPAELAGLPAEKKQQLTARGGALARRSPTLALIPSTLEGFQAGFAALDAQSGKLCDWVKAHPEAQKSISEEARAGLARQAALVHAASQILDRAHATLQSCSGESGAAKTETAANNK